MTPLAHRMAVETCLPLKDRKIRDHGDVLSKMEDLHCFEVTEVLPLIKELAAKDALSSFENLFWPAGRTWVEYRGLGAARCAFHIEQKDNDPLGRATITFVSEDNGVIISSGEKYELLPKPSGAAVPIWCDNTEYERFAMAVLALVYGALACINSPKVIGRTTKMPHAGLQRRLAKAKGVVGKYPLRAWTEIHLKAFATIDEGGKQSEIILSGRKCLHFVRAFTRVVAGKLQIVSSHWRGDPALGIKRSRYVVTN